MRIRALPDGTKMAAGMIRVTNLLHSRRTENYMFLSHEPEYLVKKIDLEKGIIEKSFRRKYPRLPFVPDEIRNFKFYNDVCGVHIGGKDVWVFTSTYEEKKGILVDVFDQQGRYKDCFFIPLLRSKTDNFDRRYSPMAIHGDYIYALEYDPEGAWEIVKYRIMD